MKRREKVAKNLLEVSTENFKKEILDSEIPVLVDFWAPWCAPCKMIAPAIEGLAEEYSGKVKFAKVNVDDNPQLATEMQVLSIPLLIVFKNGEERTRITGANPKEYIQRQIDTAIKP